MNKNYSTLMEEELEMIETKGARPSLLLHLCCAPCSSYVIELLERQFDLLLYFYDPNIHPRREYDKRRDEAKRHADFKKIEFIEGPYDVKEWFDLTKGHEGDAEKGERCSLCYDMRLAEAAGFASQRSCEYFATVLSISPHKDVKKINETGYSLSGKSGIKYLPADFKKRDGFKKSLEMSRDYGFYRQNYCGCVYSNRPVL